MGRVRGIAFVTADTGGQQVFPSADGVVQFWLEPPPNPRNMRATPKAGEARISEVEFANTNSAHADGAMGGRATLEEMAGSPIIYSARTPSGSARIWKFDPITGTAVAVSAAFTANQSYDVTVRDYHDFGYWVGQTSTGNYRVRTWFRAGESTIQTTSGFWVFFGTEEPENVDVDRDGWVWVSGDDGAGNPYVCRLDDDEPTWTLPEPTGYSYEYVDTIQCVGTDEAIGLAANLSSTGDDDSLSIFDFKVGEASAVDITDGVTVDGIDYRTWAGTTGNNIVVQSSVKMAVRDELVAAMTDDGVILLGTLVRTGGWYLGVAGWSS